MMKLLMINLFLIPLCMNWWLLCLFLCFFTFYLLMFQVNSFISYISYGLGFHVISYCMIMLTFWIMFLMILASGKIKFSLNYTVEFSIILMFLMLTLYLTFMINNLFISWV